MPYCVPAAGVVADVYGVVQAGAHVVALNSKHSCDGEDTHTSSDGSYTVNIDNSAGELATVSQPGYDPESRAIIPNPSPAIPVSQNNFTLLFTLTASISPVAFNSLSADHLLSIPASTYAPPPSGGVGAQVIAQLPNGSRLNLTQGSTTGGQTGWSGSLSVPAGAAENLYFVEVCAIRVDSSFIGNCDAAGTSLLVSHIVSASYWVDNTAPVISAQTPAPTHNTVATRPAVSVVLTDSGSGVAGETMTIDGASVTATFARGVLLFTPQADLALGVHSMSVAATDAAGNSAASSWQFDVVTLGSSATTAVVPTATASPNPNGALPPPASVTFSGVPTTLNPFDFTLSSSALTSGVGTLSIPVWFSGLQVVFSNELGQRMTTTAPEVVATYIFPIAVLEPQSARLGVNIPTVSATLPTFSVDIPSGFVATQRSIATVSGGAPVAATTPWPIDGKDPIPLRSNCSNAPYCTVRGAVVCTLALPGPQAQCNGTYPRSFLTDAAGSTADVPTTIDSYDNAADSTRRKYPAPNPAEGGVSPVDGSTPVCTANDTCQNLVKPSNVIQVLPAYWGTGPLFSAYLNNYFFGIWNGSATGAPQRLAALQASDVTPGADGCRTTNLQTFGSAIESTSDWQVSNSASFTAPPGSTPTVHPNIGPVVGYDAAHDLVYEAGFWDSQNVTNLDLSSVLYPSSSSYSGQVGGAYSTSPGSSVDSEANVVTGLGTKASLSTWTPASSRDPTIDFTTSHAEEMTVTELSPNSAANPSLRAVLYFDFSLRTRGGC